MEIFSENYLQCRYMVSKNIANFVLDSTNMFCRDLLF